MPESLADRIMRNLRQTDELYYRLMLVVAVVEQSILLPQRGHSLYAKA